MTLVLRVVCPGSLDTAELQCRGIGDLEQDRRSGAGVNNIHN